MPDEAEDEDFEVDFDDSFEPVLSSPVTARPAPVSRDVEPPQEVSAQKVLVSPGKPVIELNESIKLLAEVRMSDGQINGNVFWSSSDDRIAKVNPTTGEVTALSEGRVTVVAAYALETSVKGLAELTIVKDKTQLASDAETVPPPELPRPEAPPSLVGPEAEGNALIPDENQNTFAGRAGEHRVIGPLFLNAGIHELRVTHSGDPAGGGLFQASIYTGDGVLGENLYTDVGAFDVSFSYMIFNPGWYYVAVENSAGDWSITKR